MSPAATLGAQLAEFRRGAEQLVSEEELAAKLRRGRPLRIKFGCDPSAPDLHLGHLLGLDPLRRFQELGHTIIFLVGDFTARIGDPTGRSRTRPALSVEEVRSNARTYVEQVGAILDVNRAEIRFNSEWMDSMSPADLIRLASKHPVARMLERDDFRKRYQSGASIGIHEFLYPLIQAYDSVALQADVEEGGTDQLFNLLLGREIQREFGQEPQVIRTHPLLEGTDGAEKMSKSLGNAIGLREPPREIYGKTMSISDSALLRWLELLGPDPEGPGALDRSLHPRDLKAGLARHLVRRLHGEEAASDAERHFDALFRKREVPEDLPLIRVASREAAGVPVASLLPEARLVSSTSEAKRLVLQGGVSIDQARADDPQALVPPGEHLVRVGKRRWARVLVVPQH